MRRMPLLWWEKTWSVPDYRCCGGKKRGLSPIIMSPIINYLNPGLDGEILYVQDASPLADFILFPRYSDRTVPGEAGVGINRYCNTPAAGTTGG